MFTYTLKLTTYGSDRTTDVGMFGLESERQKSERLAGDQKSEKKETYR